MIVWGERLPDGARQLLRSRGARARRARRRRAAGDSGGANGRGLREAGVAAERRAGLRRAPRGRGAREIAAAAAAGELSALYLFGRPAARAPRPALWERALTAPRSSWPTPRSSPRGSRARQRDLPGRVLRREGGNSSTRTARAAPAHRDRASRPGARRLVGDRRDRQAARRRHRRPHQRRWRSSSSVGPCRSTPGCRSRSRRSRRALAGPRGRRRRCPSRPRAPLTRDPGDGHDTARRVGNGRAAARQLPTDLGRSRGRDLPGAPFRHRPPATRALTRGCRAPRDRRRRDRGGRLRTAPACGRPRTCVAGARPEPLPGRRDRRRVRQRAHRAAGRGAQGVMFAGVVGYFEPWWIQILKALVIFGVAFCDPADADRLRAQAARPLPGPLRAQPRRAVRAAAAAGRDRQVRHQGAVPAHDLGRLPVPARAGDRDPHGGRRRSRWCRSATSSTSSASGSGCTASTSRSGRCTCSRSAGSRSTGSCSAAGRRARSTRSWARCAAPRS